MVWAYSNSSQYPRTARTHVHLSRHQSLSITAEISGWLAVLTLLPMRRHVRPKKEKNNDVLDSLHVLQYIAKHVDWHFGKTVVLSINSTKKHDV